MLKKLKLLMTFTTLILLFTACATKAPLRDYGKIVDLDGSKEVLNFEELVSGATHILNAEYIGVHSSEYQTSLMFKPNRLIKGDVKDNIIYLNFNLSSRYEEIKYTAGENYLLFLEKNRSVYREHDIYVQRGEHYISSTSNDWENFHEQTLDIMSRLKSTAPEVYGNEFTTSSSIKDILNVSPNIFKVEIADIFTESTITPTTVYKCNVINVIQGNTFDTKDVLITLFNDTVKIGEKYVVLLADSRESHPVYTLSSKNSIYTWEEALKIFSHKPNL